MDKTNGMEVAMSLENTNDIEIARSEKNIKIVGVGMGNVETLTLEGERAIREADFLIGASRLVESLGERYEKPFEAHVKALDILNCINENQVKNFTVVMSGDTGFYSGSKRLSELLAQKGYRYQVVPGISSIQYFAAQLGTSWDDVKTVSFHGRKGDPLVDVLEHKRTFFLLGSSGAVGEICRRLDDCGLGMLQAFVGERLSYEDQVITKGYVRDFSYREFDKLSVMLVENPYALEGKWRFSGISDEEFIRGNVPMTKSEVRAVTLSKIAPEIDDVIWDIGSGTGSIAVELGIAARHGQVVAVESKAEGVLLIKKNIEKFRLQNVKVVEGKAPDIINADLFAKPDKVFIGGSGGNLEGIVKKVLRANPQAKIVVNAVTLETVAETLGLVKKLGLEDYDICQVAVTKTRKVGEYNMLDGGNPVFVMSFRGAFEKDE